jgi:hypothetical protein
MKTNMRKFTHLLLTKLINFKISDYLELGCAPNETKW